MLDQASKAFFHLLAQSHALKTLASKQGMRRPTSFARRFIAGETVEEAVAAARVVEARGLVQTLDYLGESVATLEEAETASREYVKVMDAVVASGIERNLSIKLTQLGLDLDRASTVDNLRRVLDHADGFFVRIDMESSKYIDLTLQIFETLWQHQYRQMGIVLQSALHRTDADVARMIELGARVRLVKGAYREPVTIAYASKSEVDEAYCRQLEQLMTRGNYPAIATHDTAMIAHAKKVAAQHNVGRDRFEFQMLYGIRRDLQEALVREGYRVRVYIPFGTQWFPYFMRRLGERPANVMFVLRGLLSDRGAGAAS